VLAQALFKGLLKPDATIGETVMAAKRTALEIWPESLFGERSIL
jgi:hypothetical protein